MRIVGGEYSSRRIEAPKGNATRPTLDKVREAVFSSLGGYMEDGAFLDLYAGSGANGLEALSRGASEAVLVDKSRSAAECIRANVHSLCCEDRCRVLCMSDLKALALLEKEKAVFRYVYLDPPYEKQRNERIMEILIAYGLIQRDSRVIIESLKEDSYPERIGPLRRYKTAVYGITRIHYYIFEGE